MIVRRSPTAIAWLALALGAAACAAAPAPYDRGTERSGPTSSVPVPLGPTDSPRPERAVAAASHGASPSLSLPNRGGLELDVGTVEPSWIEPMLKFASDGDSVIFSSGVADGADGEFAPDLWRYTPGTAEPELLWHNPGRERSLPLIAGDRGVWAFVDIPLDGSREWNLWLVDEPGGDAVLLDRHPGDPAVSGLLPSFDVSIDAIPYVAWTAFDAGPDGPVSQLLVASGPEWEPRLLAERPAHEAELWFPSLEGPALAYTEVIYSPDGRSDERRVFFTNVNDPAGAHVRLDSSGRAVMPVIVDDGVVWKETDPGFAMFNWGRLFFHELRTGNTWPLSMGAQDYVDRPSSGERFVAAWGSDTSIFTIHDLDRGASRTVARYEPLASESVLAPHVRGNLLVWLYTTVDDSPVPGHTELRYAYLPSAGADRLP